MHSSINFRVACFLAYAFLCALYHFISNQLQIKLITSKNLNKLNFNLKMSSEGAPYLPPENCKALGVHGGLGEDTI